MPVRTLGRIRLIQDFTIDAPASGTTDYVYAEASEFRSVMLFVEVKNLTTSRTEAFTANVANTSTTGPEDTVFGKVGENLNFKFNVLKIASDIVIRVENNESDPIQVSVIRITF